MEKPSKPMGKSSMKTPNDFIWNSKPERMNQAQSDVWKYLNPTAAPDRWESPP